jgi:tRNA nucleotidyltransferase (CCA-adding enzyme)
MSQINQIFQEVLKEIRPRPQDLKIINDIIARLKKLLIAKAKDINIAYTTIEPQGSTGIKQTNLRNDFDIDLFIGLDYSLYKPKYEGLSKSKLKSFKKRFSEPM